MGDTTDLVIPGAEWDAHEHADGDLDALLRVVAMYGIAVPEHSAPYCGAVHSSGMECTRAAGHTGRHHASFPWSGAVVAVWHQHNW